ncbi:probable HAD-superfamily hydrolase, subfamily IA, variant 1 [Crocosphaera subtropica ATCC 51142]|uniref:Probable HAD-superfamily hydrolase, subfamily IA, variant 1 n=1 Tax=Crocosphaera subtropica (strain ATCC 51142 / BH68) TaxID=43989 RepID=B1WR46_CROS5|nr:HAD-IIIC family phosphatase [Crocosphaera subtropica]ACB50104.1 probable HAD-superfamily hydrolase, subfamily IA, variant 1 [Crocosphaera subtropica ATCC 51142]
MTLKVIVFDFDGTLADTYEAFVTIANSLSEEFGYKPVNKQEQEKLKHLSARDLIKQSEISPLKIPFVLKRVKSELTHKIKELEPIKEIPYCIKQLKKQGYTLGIITSNAEDNVLSFLENHQLEQFFDFIYAGTTLFGKHKIIKKLLKEKHLLPNEVVYIGDETRDINSAKKSQIKCVGVTWGFNSSEALAKENPDFLINSPYELITILENYRYKVLDSESRSLPLTMEEELIKNQPLLIQNE